MVKSSPLILLLRKSRYRESKELAQSHSTFLLHVHIGCFPYSCGFVNLIKFIGLINLILTLAKGGKLYQCEIQGQKNGN